jgi:hypothetical protein
MQTLKANGGKGEIQKEIIGQVTCTRYVGEFRTAACQTLADTGLWYTMLSGNPFVVQGEGATPQAAIQDSIVCTKAEMGQMQKGLDCMSKL